MTIHNHTPFTHMEITNFRMLGKTISKWRQRTIRLYQHPHEADKVISVGASFDGKIGVIAIEDKSAWTIALDYASKGEVYVSE